jgi:hypothetical protein
MNGMPRKKVVQSGGQWPHGDKQREKSQMATGGGGGGNYAENNGQSENAMSDAERLKEVFFSNNKTESISFMFSLPAFLQRKSSGLRQGMSRVKPTFTMPKRLKALGNDPKRQIPL